MSEQEMNNNALFYYTINLLKSLVSQGKISHSDYDNLKQMSTNYYGAKLIVS